MTRPGRSRTNGGCPTGGPGRPRRPLVRFVVDTRLTCRLHLLARCAMNVVTGRGAARDHEDRPTGPAVGGDPGPSRCVPARRGRAAAPARAQRRPGCAAAHPGGEVAPRPAPRRRRRHPHRLVRRRRAPVPSPVRPGSSGPPAGAAPAGAEPVEVEPTTGAPVDAVPRRVPVRQQGRRQRAACRPDGDPPDDERRVLGADRAGALGRHPGPQGPGTGAARGVRPALRRAPSQPPPPPDPLPGLAALVVAEPGRGLLRLGQRRPVLAGGRARPDGTVVIDDCTGGGLTLRCRGIFTAEDGRFIAHGVRVSGVPVEAEHGRHRAAGADDRPGRRHRVRGRRRGPAPAAGCLGLLVVLACAAGIVRWTGSARLPGRRHRRWAVAAAIAGPTLITVGFLAAACVNRAVRRIGPARSAVHDRVDVPAAQRVLGGDVGDRVPAGPARGLPVGDGGAQVVVVGPRPAAVTGAPRPPPG